MMSVQGDFPEFEAMKEKLEKEYRENPDGLLNEKGKADEKEYQFTTPKQEWKNSQYQEWKKKEQVE